MLTFVFLDYHSAEATLKCIRHFIEKCNGCSEPISFVVVDNSVDDENFKALSQAYATNYSQEFDGSILEKKDVEGHQLFLWKNTANVGYARGNNAGARIAAEFLKSDYLIFSNNDLLVLDEHLDLERLIAEVQKMDVAIVGPSIVGKNGKSQNPYFDKPFFLRWGLEYLCYPLAKFLPRKLQSGDLIEKFVANPVDRVMGSFFLISRKCFESVGGFDPHTFLFAEELILSKRLKDCGCCVHYVPEVHLLHNHSEIINKNYDYGRRLVLRFESEAYYYGTYRNVGSLRIAIVRWIVKSYIFRKNLVKKLKSIVR